MSGKIGAGYSIAYSPRRTLFDKLFPIFNTAYAAGATVNKIIAVQSDRGYLAAYSMENSVSAFINPDGTFSLTLDKDKDWLLVLMDSAAPAVTDQFIGYIDLSGGGSNSLLIFPSSTASSTLSSLDLGSIDASGDTGVTQSSINAADFSMNQNQLAMLAMNDDVFKSVKNFVINYQNGVFYTLRPDFSMNGTYNDIKNQFPDLAVLPSFYTYSHYNFQMDSNSTEVTVAQITGDGVPKVSVELYPPADVVATSPAITYTTSTPVANETATGTVASDGFVDITETANGDFYATDRYGDISYTLGGSLTGDIPAGYWQYKVGGALRAQFDVSVTKPLTSGGLLKGFVPVIKINTDPVDTDKITSINIKWYYLNETGSGYTEVTDIGVLKYLIGSSDIYLDNTTNSVRTYESIGLDPATDSTITPTQYTWYFGSTNGPANRQAQGIGITYQSGGIGYKFEYFRP